MYGLLQPDHLLDDAGSAIKKLGLQRAEKSSYLFRSLLSSGAKLAFGSDWPVSIFITTSGDASVGTIPIKLMRILFSASILHIIKFFSFWFQVADIYPLRSMQTAMKRTPSGWEGSWMSSECININDALKA